MKLRDFFESEKIHEYSILPFDEVTIIDERRANRLFNGKNCLTVVPFLIPYLVKDNAKSNISLYAHAKDYHYYFKALTERLKSAFGDLATGCDVSPINEVDCAVRAGLGSIGKNGLLINKRYGSYVFVAEIFFSADMSDPIFEGISRREKGSLCMNCRACERACPNNALKDKTRCISYINQKKKLDEGDAELIKRSGSVWGCDICQLVCPYNRVAKETEIEFFRQDRTPLLTDALLDEMVKNNSFSERAYAWRGEAVVRRNISLCKDKENALQ